MIFSSVFIILTLLFAGVIGTSTTLPADEFVMPEDRTVLASQFGAIPDGQTLNTVTLQKAIDACHEAGGGTVRFTPGTWLTGTLFLKSHVRLLLDENAVILGSPHREDYLPLPGVNVRGKPRFLVSHFGNNIEESSCLIFALDQKGFAIEGHGTIDGNGKPGIWWDEEKMCNPYVKDPNRWRPRALVAFISCRDVTIRDIHLVDSPCYTLWPIACQDVVIDGITIDNPQDGPNTDGLDIDCCNRVMVSNCNIRGGDDAIALKSDSGILGEDEIPCENITVTNCVLQSGPANGIRLGFEGDSFIRDCTFSNITIWDSACGIQINSTTCDRPDFTILKGSRNENILFDTIIMRDIKGLAVLYAIEGGESDHTVLRNIHVSNLIATGRTCEILVKGLPFRHADNISFSNILLQPTAPVGTYMKALDTDNLRIENFRVDLAPLSTELDTLIHLTRCRDASLRQVQPIRSESAALNALTRFEASTGRLYEMNKDAENRPAVTADNESNVVQE